MIPVPLLNPTFRTRTRREVRANFGFAAVAIGPVRLARRLAQRREAGLAMQCSTLPPADIMHCSRVTEAQLVEPNLRIIDAACN